MQIVDYKRRYDAASSKVGDLRGKLRHVTAQLSSVPAPSQSDDALVASLWNEADLPASAILNLNEALRNMTRNTACIKQDVESMRAELVARNTEREQHFAHRARRMHALSATLDELEERADSENECVSISVESDDGTPLHSDAIPRAEHVAPEPVPANETGDSVLSPSALRVLEKYRGREARDRRRASGYQAVNHVPIMSGVSSFDLGGLASAGRSENRQHLSTQSPSLCYSHSQYLTSDAFEKIGTSSSRELPEVAGMSRKTSTLSAPGGGGFIDQLFMPEYIASSFQRGASTRDSVSEEEGIACNRVSSDSLEPGFQGRRRGSREVLHQRRLSSSRSPPLRQFTLEVPEDMENYETHTPTHLNSSTPALFPPFRLSFSHHYDSPTDNKSDSSDPITSPPISLEIKQRNLEVISGIPCCESVGKSSVPVSEGEDTIASSLSSPRECDDMDLPPPPPQQQAQSPVVKFFRQHTVPVEPEDLPDAATAPLHEHISLPPGLPLSPRDRVKEESSSESLFDTAEVDPIDPSFVEEDHHVVSSHEVSVQVDTSEAQFADTTHPASHDVAVHVFTQAVETRHQGTSTPHQSPSSKSTQAAAELGESPAKQVRDEGTSTTPEGVVMDPIVPPFSTGEDPEAGLRVEKVALELLGRSITPPPSAKAQVKDEGTSTIPDVVVDAVVLPIVDDIVVPHVVPPPALVWEGQKKSKVLLSEAEELRVRELLQQRVALRERNSMRAVHEDGRDRTEHRTPQRSPTESKSEYTTPVVRGGEKRVGSDRTEQPTLIPPFTPQQTQPQPQPSPQIQPLLRAGGERSYGEERAGQTHPPRTPQPQSPQPESKSEYTATPVVRWEGGEKRGYGGGAIHPAFRASPRTASPVGYAITPIETVASAIRPVSMSPRPPWQRPSRFVHILW